MFCAALRKYENRGLSTRAVTASHRKQCDTMRARVLTKVIANTLLTLRFAYYGMLQPEVVKDGWVGCRNLLKASSLQEYITPDPGLQAGDRMVHGILELMELYHQLDPAVIVSMDDQDDQSTRTLPPLDHPCYHRMQKIWRIVHCLKHLGGGPLHHKTHEIRLSIDRVESDAVRTLEPQLVDGDLLKPQNSA